jgi:predicted ribosomally synthesized peptide with nif11-like leader
MSKEQFLSFLEAVNTDSALQEMLRDAAEPDAVAAIAQSAGFESVSPELVTDFLDYVAAQSASEQKSEQELSAVSGGLSPLAIAGIATGSAVTVLAGAAVIANCYIKSNETSNLNSSHISVETIDQSDSRSSFGRLSLKQWAPDMI